LIADDHPAIVKALGAFLTGEDEFELLGRTGDGDQALRMIEASRPDVAVLDVRMPGLSGIEIARRLVAAKSRTGVILYTAYGERALVLEALDAGARGFLLKEAPLEDLVRALRMVAAGGTYVDPGLAGTITGAEATARLPSLTKREREVLRLVADGMRTQAVGERLFISPLTVRTHVRNAMRKLDADTRTQAVASALRQSLIV
jgi:DNA-binding NarL/FixJ family response regulator